MIIPISVIICTHNPNKCYLTRVLEALKKQTLAKDFWELILVDNLSNDLLSEKVDISWKQKSRHARETQLGLTYARLRGIRESQGKILVFVDDDNVLNTDYLKNTLRISKEYPFIGAWGGQIQPEFEVDPPDWTKPYWGALAIREFERDLWSNLLDQHTTTPCGAGICVRREVAMKYSELVNSNERRLKLDRKGDILLSHGDSDLAWTAYDLGMGTGQFTALKLTHLIPEARLQRSYLENLVEGMSYSAIILQSIRGTLPREATKVSWRTKLFKQYQRFRMHPCQRAISLALERGERRAFHDLNLV